MYITIPDAPAVTVFVALGSNLGEREAALRGAMDAMADLPWTRVEAVSSFHETEAVGPGHQPAYLNAACRLKTPIAPGFLAFMLHGVEQAFGRRRHDEPRWAARTLDLDLLVHGDRRMDEPELTIPHPRLACRRFVLAPLAEVCDSPIPGLGATPRELLARLPA